MTSTTVPEKLIDGSLSSAVATLVSNPFDVMRVRMQLQGEMQRRGEFEVLYRNLPQGMWRVVREEGVLGLQKGLCPAVLWQVSQNGIRIGMYPDLKERTRAALRLPPPRVGPAGPEDSFLVCAAASAVCGVVGSYVSCPFNMVKTRLQAQYGREALQKVMAMTSVAGAEAARPAAPASAEEAAYAGVRDAMRRIYRAGGVRGLWQGALVSAQRTVMLSLTQLPSYDYAKRGATRLTGLPAADARVHVLASALAAACIVAVMNPLEVVLTRAFNRRTSAPPGAARYSSNLAVATAQVFRVEGLHGLYKGSTAYFARCVPHNIVIFVVLEALQNARTRKRQAARA